MYRFGRYIGCMLMDLTLACLLIFLGAMISYALDEHLRVTARFSDWLREDETSTSVPGVPGKHFLRICLGAHASHSTRQSAISPSGSLVPPAAGSGG